MDLKDIKAIIDLMKKNSVSEFELEKQDFKIRLKRGTGHPAPNLSQGEDATSIIYAPPPSQIPGGGISAQPANPSPSVLGEIEIKSPMIGTFYRAPSPESAPYIEVGMEVSPDMVVCIVEAMKVMNEIKSEVKGVVTQVLVENGKPVEFGQPLFKVRPA